MGLEEKENKTNSEIQHVSENCENEKQNELQYPNNDNTEISSELNEFMDSASKVFKCEICRKLLQNKNNLEKHDIQYHIHKNKTAANCFPVYKSDNCDEVFSENSKISNLPGKFRLGLHVKRNHKICSNCKKIFPDKKSLAYHITAVHDKVKTKHQIEKEPSMTNHKIKKVHA